MKVCGTDGERNFFGFFFTRFLNVLLVFQLYDFFLTYTMRSFSSTQLTPPSPNSTFLRQVIGCLVCPYRLIPNTYPTNTNVCVYVGFTLQVN